MKWAIYFSLKGSNFLSISILRSYYLSLSIITLPAYKFLKFNVLCFILRNLSFKSKVLFYKEIPLLVFGRLNIVSHWPHLPYSDPQEFGILLSCKLD